MKWLTQKIHRFISRFRNDVYLDSLTITTDTGLLVVDSNNKVCKNPTVIPSTKKACFEFKGYGTSSADGEGATQYEMPELMTDTKAPFEHDTATGADGLTAQSVNTIIRSGGIVMPYAGTLENWTGWSTSSGTGDVDIALFKYTPARNDASTVTPVLLKNFQYVAIGNTKMMDFAETSFSVAFAAQDILYSAVKGDLDGEGGGEAWYFLSTLEVEWS